MNICLIRPPALIDARSFSMNPSPPLGLAFIAGALHGDGHTVKVIDAIGESPRQMNPIEFSGNTITRFVPGDYSTNGLSTSEILELVPQKVEMIGVSCMFSNNWLADRQLIAALRKRFPEAFIVAGGESISAIPEHWMQQAPQLDLCVVGEGEETICEVVRHLEQGLPIHDVQGIVFRSHEGAEPIRTPRRNRVKAIDTLPNPAWQLFPLNNYEVFKVQWGITSRKSLPVLATRGCPYSCTFCSSPLMWTTRYYMRTPQHVADELERLNRDYGIGNFDFYDLTAIIKKEWIVEFAKEIINRKLDINWQIPAGTRSEAIDGEVAYYLRRSGCTDITYAPESGSTRMLKLVKKKVDLNNMLASMTQSHREGMHIYINMILGLPDETHRDVRQTLWFLVKCSWVGVNELGIAMFHPYPGSALFDRLREEGSIDLSKDDLVLSTIRISPFGRPRYLYNKQIGPGAYHLYILGAMCLFYSTNYLFRPIRLYRMLRNVITGRHATRTERALRLVIERSVVKPWEEATQFSKAASW
jgi:radical SAM superfamily enzyme YgiQ (UPF0313 family)